jgi:adenosine kinase
MNVVVTGSLGFDYIMDFSGRFKDRIMPDKIHNISLSFLVDTLTKQFGGTAGNIGYTLKLLGINPLIVAAAGNDFTAYKRFLAKHKISTTYISVRQDVPTSSYFVMTDTDDNQIGSFYMGSMKYAKNLTIPEKSTFVLVTPNEPAAVMEYVAQCKKRHLPYLYDPAFQIDHFTAKELRDGISGAKILIGNDYEISLIEHKLAIPHKELIRLVPMLITTLGSKGSIIETDEESVHCKPAKPKNVIDPTGAGDAFRAGFIAGYLRHYDVKICGQMGSVAAVYTVETYGTQTHTFTKKEFIKRYRENFGDTITL